VDVTARKRISRGCFSVRFFPKISSVFGLGIILFFFTPPAGLGQSGYLAGLPGRVNLSGKIAVAKEVDTEIEYVHKTREQPTGRNLMLPPYRVKSRTYLFVVIDFDTKCVEKWYVSDVPGYLEARAYDGEGKRIFFVGAEGTIRSIQSTTSIIGYYGISEKRFFRLYELAGGVSGLEFSPARGSLLFAVHEVPVEGQPGTCLMKLLEGAAAGGDLESRLSYNSFLRVVDYADGIQTLLIKEGGDFVVNSKLRFEQRGFIRLFNLNTSEFKKVPVSADEYISYEHMAISADGRSIIFTGEEKGDAPDSFPFRFVKRGGYKLYFFEPRDKVSTDWLRGDFAAAPTGDYAIAVSKTGFSNYLYTPVEFQVVDLTTNKIVYSLGTRIDRGWFLVGWY
jgi:hypothetical protein